MDTPPHKDMITVPALVGAYAVAGLYIQRGLRGSTTPLQVEQVALIAGTSAVAAFVTPFLTRPFVCPYRPTAPFADAGVSSALVYTLMRLESVDAEGAAMFVPVQLLSTLLAHHVARLIRSSKKETKSLEEEEK